MHREDHGHQPVGLRVGEMQSRPEGQAGSVQVTDRLLSGWDASCVRNGLERPTRSGTKSADDISPLSPAIVSNRDHLPRTAVLAALVLASRGGPIVMLQTAEDAKEGEGRSLRGGRLNPNSKESVRRSKRSRLIVPSRFPLSKNPRRRSSPVRRRGTALNFMHFGSSGVADLCVALGDERHHEPLRNRVLHRANRSRATRVS